VNALNDILCDSIVSLLLRTKLSRWPVVATVASDEYARDGESIDFRFATSAECNDKFIC
jgi:hypothetical protein